MEDPKGPYDFKERNLSLRKTANSIITGDWLKSSKMFNQQSGNYLFPYKKTQNKTNHQKKPTKKHLTQNRKIHVDLMFYSWKNILSSLSDIPKMTGNFFTCKICSLQDGFDESLFYFEIYFTRV